MSETTTDRVADAPADIWVYRLLPKSIWPYAQLARWDRPIGWWLLLWPCWWSLALAFGHLIETQTKDVTSWADAFNIFSLQLFLFWLGAVVMRGAGCTYNDLIDVGIDLKVTRTASRPIPSGRVSKKQAVVFTILQSLIGFACLLGISFVWQSSFSFFVVGLGVVSLLIVACYPFAKRITNWPQFVLGLAFSWGALMGWASVFEEIAIAPLLLYVGCILWTIGYDTMYAHQDKEDDALIGVRSTARLFGDKTKQALTILYSGALILFAVSFGVAEANWPSYVGLAIGGAHMIWQIRTLDINDSDKCLALFQSNKMFGWIIFTGLLADIFI